MISRCTFILTVSIAFLTLLSPAQAQQSQNSLGVGANYFVALDDLESEIDENGFSYFVSYQYRSGGLLNLEANFEVLPEVFGVRGLSPSAYLILGRNLYVAAGIGIIEYDGEWAEDPFFAFKLGLNFAITGNLQLDAFANYRAQSSVDFEDSLDEIDTDTVFFGGAVRWAF